jgi:hypothetical protein
MAYKGQTHQKRARELALKERRERKAAKKEARALGLDPSVEGGEGMEGVEGVEGEPGVETVPEPVDQGWIQ